MNFATVVVERGEIFPSPVTAYGLTYAKASATIPGNGDANTTHLTLLCYEQEGPKLNTFMNWEKDQRMLVCGQIMFSGDSDKRGEPLEIIVNSIVPVGKDAQMNEIVLGNGFFGQGKEDVVKQKSGNYRVNVGTTLDNSDHTTWFYCELNEGLWQQKQDRIRSGRYCVVAGYIREYRKEEGDSPYRAIVARDFTVRKDKDAGGGSGRSAKSREIQVEPAPVIDL